MKISHIGFSSMRIILTLLLINISLSVSSAFAVGGGAVSFIEIQQQGVNGVDGLNGISDIAVSADGKFVYSASYASNAVSTFQRDPVTGKLTYVSSVSQGVNGISTLINAFSIVSSSDNKSIYVASPGGSVSAFSRNELTGELTFVNAVTSGQNGMTIAGFVSVSISPDGKSVYGIGGAGVHGLAIFNRNLTTGAITFAGQQVDNQNGNYLGQGFSPTASPIKNIAVSASGTYLYVTSTTDDAVSLYSRNLTTGLLTLVAAYRDGVGGIDGIDGASSLTLSPDGKNLYVSGQAENSLAIFNINQTSGVLTYLTKITHNVNGVTSLLEARSLGVSPDGKYVYCSAIASNAITAFSRDPATGLLTVDTVVTDDMGGVDGLSAASGMSTDPLNRHLYVAGQGEQALAVFSLPIPAVALSTNQQAATVSGPAVILDPQLEIYDSDSVNLVSASVAINSGFINTDVLSIITQGGIAASYNAGTGVLSLTGVASLADYKATLRTLTYTAGADASLSTGQSSSRSIGITVSDGDNMSAAAIVTMSVMKTTLVTVTFVDWDSNVLKTEQVASGGAATAPTQPTRTGYTFSGWDVSFSNVTAALTVTAQYTVSNYAVTFDLAGGTRTGGGDLQQTIIHGQAATAPLFSAPTGKTFSGWSTSFSNITAVTTVTAQYTLNNYTVTAAISGNGTITPASQQVAYGATGSFTLALGNAGDAVTVNSNCGATLSGSQLVTSAIEEDCAIALVVYPAVVVTRENSNPSAVNSATRFNLGGGTGEQLLASANVLRSGAETQLENNESSALVTRQSDGSYLFSASRTGRYTLNYVDTTSGQQVSTSFDVLPYLAFTSSQQPVQQDTASMLRIWLSDEPIEYPVHVDFAAVGASVAAEQFEINAGDNRQASYSVSATAATATVSLVKDSLVGAMLGTPALHTLAVQQALPPLSLNVTATQNGQQTYVVSNSAGVVTLNAIQLNDSETSTYSWTGDGLIFISTGASASFDPANLAAGLYKLSVNAVTSSGRVGRYDLALRVISSCPVANCDNTSVSGIPASVNPVAQTPNRLPICPNVNADSRVGNCQVAGAESLYAEAPNQYSLTLGALSGEQSWGSGQFGMALNDNSLVDGGYSRVGTILNFDVVGLENPGEAVPVAIPLPVGTSIPENAVWRKFINNQWQDFVVDNANAIHSAARDALGQCPGVSSDVWSEGLTAGHGCVRLTIADGGPNDDDGIANSVIRDPGVLAIQDPVVPPVNPVAPVKNTHVKSAGGSIDGFALFALGLLALARSRKIWTALVVLLSPAAMAGNIYLGLDGLLVHSSASNKTVTENLHEAGLSGSADLENTWRNGGRIYAGYKLDDKVALEVGWLDLGHATTHFSDVPASATKNQLASVLPHSGEGAEVAIHWTICDISDRIKPGIRAGVWQMRYANRYFDGVEVIREKKSDRVPFVGLDLDMSVTEQWSTRIGVSSYFAENENIGTVNLGLSYHF